MLNKVNREIPDEFLKNGKEVYQGKFYMDGKYVKKVEGKNVHYKYKWILEKDFEVTDTEAKKLNNSDPTVEKKNSINWVMIIGLGIIALLLVIIFLLLKRRKEDKSDKE